MVKSAVKLSNAEFFAGNRIKKQSIKLTIEKLNIYNSNSDYFHKCGSIHTEKTTELWHHSYRILQFRNEFT